MSPYLLAKGLDSPAGLKLPLQAAWPQIANHW